MNLHQLQQAFSDTLFDSGSGRILPCLNGPSDSRKNRRLDIYRNNVFHSLSNALADLYPATRRLVGDGFFNATAREFVRQHPPRSAAMVHFGADLPAFLQEFEHTSALAWLADVARLELARHRAYHAKDAKPLSVDDLTAVPAEQLSQARLILHPSITQIESGYPVLSIWQANQDDEPDDEVIDLDSGGCKLVVYRPHNDVVIGEVDDATHALLATLQQGDTLESALMRVSKESTNSSIPELFASCIQAEFFTEIIGS